MTNKELVLKFYDDVFNGWNLDNLEEYMREDYKQHNPTVEDGIEGFRKFATGFFNIKPHMEIKKIICEDDMVCVFFKCVVGINGTYNKVFDLYRIEDGKLAEHWDCIQHYEGGEETANGNDVF